MASAACANFQDIHVSLHTLLETQCDYCEIQNKQYIENKIVLKIATI
jgi:hypothetical protein